MATVVWATSLNGATTEDDTPRYIEQVIVTGEKREQDLQSAAVAGTVFNDELLRKNSIDEIDDLEFATPSLTIATAGQSNQMNLRGIGKFDSGGTSTSAVATYRDGVGTVSGFFNQEPYYDLESVEVLRGPQGTYVGENAAAGAIFVNTQDPEIGGGYEGFMEAGYGNYDAVELTAASNIPLGERAALRVAGRHVSRDSFFDVYTDPEATIRHPNDPGEIDHDSVRVGLLLQPIDPLDVLFKVDVNRLDHGGHVFGNVPGFPTPVGSITGEPYGNISDDLYTVGNNFPGVFAEDKMNRVIMDVGYNFSGGGSLRWVSGYQHINTHIRNDDDGSVDEDLRIHINPIFDVYTSEATFISPADRSFRWLAGAFYRREELEFPEKDGFKIFNGPDPAVLGLSILWDTTRETEAVYGQVAYDLTPSLELEVGLRLQRYESSQDADILFGGLPFLGPRIDSYDEDTLSYKAALNWQATDAHYLYALVATGNTTGGSSVVLGVPNFSNQESTDFEAGWKGTLFGGRLLTQFGGFYAIIDDYQATFSAVIDATMDPPLLSSTFQNLDGDTKTWGIEMQAQAQFENLGLDFNAAWIHSELGDDLIFDTTLQRFIETGGNRIPWTPKYTFNAGVQYDFHLGNDAVLTPRVTYSWIDDQLVTPTDRVINGTSVDRIFSHDLVNVQLNFTMGPWRAQAYMTNAAEEEYIQAHSGDAAHPDAYANEPRRYGLRVTRSFGF
jgi:iron complex outermembrane receptor protein